MAAEPENLSSRARAVCETATLVLSVASIWEIAIKWSAGRLPLPKPPHEYVSAQIRQASVTILPIYYRHALASSTLPPHKNPFDRMLAAQCLEEKLPCVTDDVAIGEYGVEIIW